jgi:hypothetical protein
VTLDHHDEPTAQAMRTLARAITAQALTQYTVANDDRRHFPHLDDYDRGDILTIAAHLTPPPNPADTEAAYQHLTKRAGGAP